MTTQQAEPKAAVGFIPVAMPVDGDLTEVRHLAKVGAKYLGGTVLGDVELTWNDNLGGFDAHCMVIPHHADEVAE